MLILRHGRHRPLRLAGGRRGRARARLGEAAERADPPRARIAARVPADLRQDAGHPRLEGQDPIARAAGHDRLQLLEGRHSTSAGSGGARRSTAIGPRRPPGRPSSTSTPWPRRRTCRGTSRARIACPRTTAAASSRSPAAAPTPRSSASSTPSPRRSSPDGFTLPEAKSSVTWRDADTLWVGTDFGPGSLTTSGYPRVVKLWKRGTPLADATTVFEGSDKDVASYGTSLFTAGPPLRPRDPHSRLLQAGDVPAPGRSAGAPGDPRGRGPERLLQGPGPLLAAHGLDGRRQDVPLRERCSPGTWTTSCWIGPRRRSCSSLRSGCRWPAPAPPATACWC